MRLALASSGALLLLFLAGCSSKQPTSPPLFGGQGAVVASPKELPLPAESHDSKAAAGPCGRATPPSDGALIDDFEDGDGKPFKVFQREGWWYAASDKTEGSKLYPAGNFMPERLSSSESSKDNLFVAHLVADGQKEWGALWGSTLRWVKDGIRCPLNVSAFAGIRFRAKGPAKVYVKFQIPETTPKEYGGICTQRCYDAYGKLVILSERWDEYQVLWEKLQQQGWGAEARFDPSRVLAVDFAVGIKELPADFWIDDVEFVAKKSGAPTQQIQ